MFVSGGNLSNLIDSLLAEPSGQLSVEVTSMYNSFQSRSRQLKENKKYINRKNWNEDLHLN